MPGLPRNPIPGKHSGITWREKNVAEILGMSVEEASEFFAGEEEIIRSLSALIDVGLGYLRLGQPATELSGGEAQRVKLASELQHAGAATPSMCWTNRRPDCIVPTLTVLVTHLQTLVEAGNTVVMVGLDMRVVAAADHVIDLGPGAGDAGGTVVACGTPAQIVGRVSGVGAVSGDRPGAIGCTAAARVVSFSPPRAESGKSLNNSAWLEMPSR